MYNHLRKYIEISVKDLITLLNQKTSEELGNSNIKIEEDQNINFIRLLLNLTKLQTIWNLCLSYGQWGPSLETERSQVKCLPSQLLDDYPHCLLRSFTTV